MIHIMKRIRSFAFPILLLLRWMFSTKGWANTAKFNLTFISLVQTKGIINYHKCKLIIVNYFLVWSASSSSVFFSIFLDMFRVPFFPPVSQTEEACTDLYRYLTKPSLLFPDCCLHASFWIQTSEVAAYMNCIFKRRFVRIKLYLMSKLLRFLLYCFKCNKLYFSKNEHLYLLAANRLIFSLLSVTSSLTASEV